jgi:hypothetical protein
MRFLALPLSLALIPALTAAQPGSPGHWNVVTAGAVGDGKTDCTAVFQGLLDEAGKAGGGVVEVPAGRFRLDGTLSIPANVTLQGIFQWAPCAVSIADATGSVLCAYAGRGEPESPAFIRLAGDNAAVTGLTIVYPEWNKEDVPPVPYPPCILSRDTLNVSIQNCLLLNPYEGIVLERAHRHLVRNITGYPIRRGIYVDECYDIGHVENIHYWPFGTAFDPNNAYSRWINTQGVAFEFARTDWEYVLNTFCFGYGVGYKFSASAHGSANGNFHGLGADSCERAVVVDQAQPPGLLLTNGEFVGRWGSQEAVCMEIGPDVEGPVSLVNCSFWGPIDRCVWMRSKPGQFTASACHFVNWDNRGVGSPALQLDAGCSIVQGCTFDEDNLDVAVGPEVVSAILTANQASGGFRADNQAGRRTQMGLNQADPVDWTDEALMHYQIEVGSDGDGRFLRGFGGHERVGNAFRWSGPASSLILPLPVGKACTVTVEGEIPGYAVGPDSGLYLGQTLLAPLVSGKPLAATIPATDTGRVRLELRCQGWVPQELIPGSQDPRTLGLQVQRVTVRAEGAGAAAFSANTGQWLPAEPAAN